jgi:hypothetical protein
MCLLNADPNCTDSVILLSLFLLDKCTVSCWMKASAKCPNCKCKLLCIILKVFICLFVEVLVVEELKQQYNIILHLILILGLSRISLSLNTPGSCKYNIYCGNITNVCVQTIAFKIRKPNQSRILSSV